MQNIKASVKGNKLTLEIDLSQTLGPSKSGKTTLIASSGGNQLIEGTSDVYLGLNLYKPKK